MPTKDHPNRITAHTAAAVLFEIVSLVADGFRSPRPGALIAERPDEAQSTPHP